MPHEIRRNFLVVTINGEKRELGGAASIAALLRELQLNPGSVAVELNRQIVRRAGWEATPIHDGDVLEIVQLVGGG